MKIYHRISFSEREKLYQLRQNKHNQASIAKILGRSKSTISRELSRFNAEFIGYIPDRAQKQAESSLSRNTKLFRNEKLSALVISFLQEGWSPEQIAGRLKHENKALGVISHETIYQFIYSKEGQAQKLYKLLTRQKPKRTRWHSRKPKKSYIPESAHIINRPKSIDNRKKRGHWEGDLVIFTHSKSSNVTTLIERKSRLVKLVHNKSKYTDEVIGGIAKSMQAIHPTCRETITFDRGTEFASFKNLDMTTYFCDPHSPWQKGSNENYNGRLRRYLPKKFEHRNLSQDLLDSIEEKMNNQPRKCIGFRTPAEAFYQLKFQYVALGT